jgi:diadenosine tetraphosphate (Ap4A) HIT family hydrolase
MKSQDSLTRFLHTVQGESHLYENCSFVLVEDRFPVLAGHLLLVARRPWPSLADCSWPELNLTLSAIRSVLEGRGCYFMLEHGRRSLCISDDSPAHAHAHVVPLAEFNGFVEHDFRAFHDLKTTYGSIPADTEYLLWGNLRDGSAWYVKAPLTNAPKSIIRQRLALNAV